MVRPFELPSRQRGSILTGEEVDKAWRELQRLSRSTFDPAHFEVLDNAAGRLIRLNRRSRKRYRAYLPSGSFPGRTGTIATGTTDGTATVTLLR